MPGERYRPSNGTEGADFICEFCCRCQRDVNEDCEILAATFRMEVDDPLYPPEWCFDDQDSPVCTAFVPLGDPLPERCAFTLDMFD